MAALEPFAELLAGSDERIELVRACLLIAEDAYPGLDVEGYVSEVERLALRLRTRLARDAGASRVAPRKRHPAHAVVVDDPGGQSGGSYKIGISAQREARVLKQLLGSFSALLNAGGVLQEDNVPRHQIRRCKANDLIEGIVPRLDAKYDAQRLAQERGVSSRRVDRLGLQ